MPSIQGQERLKPFGKLFVVFYRVSFHLGSRLLLENIPSLSYPICLSLSSSSLLSLSLEKQIDVAICGSLYIHILLSLFPLQMQHESTVCFT